MCVYIYIYMYIYIVVKVGRLTSSGAPLDLALRAHLSMARLEIPFNCVDYLEQQ